MSKPKKAPALTLTSLPELEKTLLSLFEKCSPSGLAPLILIVVDQSVTINSNQVGGKENRSSVIITNQKGSHNTTCNQFGDGNAIDSDYTLCNKGNGSAEYRSSFNTETSVKGDKNTIDDSIKKEVKNE